MIGKTVSRYRVGEKLGGGGMGVVYKAEDTRLERTVALKLLNPSLTADPKARARLLREARTASALNHPHVSTIYDVGEADGETFIAMELVEGRPLSDLVGNDELTSEKVLRYGAQISDALAHAHGRGIIHRDLKSSNIMITPDGRAKVLDFGLAKRFEDTGSEETISGESATLEEPIAGTLHYMAPEVLKGEATDARSDLWSLSVLLYEAAAGKRPFHGKTIFELTSAILKDPLSVPANLPAGLRILIRRCLQKNPEERTNTPETSAPPSRSSCRKRPSCRRCGTSWSADGLWWSPTRWRRQSPYFCCLSFVLVKRCEEPSGTFPSIWKRCPY